MAAALEEMYAALLDHFGPQGWWPGDTPLEVMVGAVLTQNTNWENVSRAIDNLKRDNLLSLTRLLSLPQVALAETIRPSGYYNLKAARLHNLLAMIYREEPDGDLDRFFAADSASLREKLLAVKGIGPETADSIMLYAAGKPIFVVDAYTHQIASRHGLIDTECDYHQLQALFMDNLPLDASLFNEFHALLVRLGKEFCKKRSPRCQQCPLGRFEPLLLDE